MNEQNPIVQASDIPLERRQTGTIPAPTWRRANRSEIFLWLFVGFLGAVFLGGLVFTATIGAWIP